VSNKRSSFGLVVCFVAAIMTTDAAWQNNAIGQFFSCILIALPILHALTSLLSSLRIRSRRPYIVGIILAAVATFVAVHAALSY
jgi:hypothetical protein